MSDLHDLLHAEAPDPSSPLDADAIRARARARTRNARLARIGVPLVLVVALGVGVMAIGDDGAPTVSVDQADDPTQPDPGGSAPPTTTPSLPTNEDGSDTSPTVGVEGPATSAPEPAEPEDTEDVEPSPTQDANTAARLTDPAGDTAEHDPWAVPGTTRHPEPTLDLVGGSIHLDGEILEFRIDLDDLDDDGPRGADGGAYRFSFRYEDPTTSVNLELDMQRYNGHQFVRFHGDPGAQPCDECTVRFDAERDAVIAHVPRAALATVVEDTTGQPTMAGGRLTHLRLGTQWVHTSNDLSRCEDQDRYVDCPPGPYAAASADDAEGTEELALD